MWDNKNRIKRKKRGKKNGLCLYTKRSINLDNNNILVISNNSKCMLISKIKRKTIKNNLVGYDLDIISNILTKYGFDINTRSENIPYNVFVEIANELC